MSSLDSAATSVQELLEPSERSGSSLKALKGYLKQVTAQSAIPARPLPHYSVEVICNLVQVVNIIIKINCHVSDELTSETKQILR